MLTQRIRFTIYEDFDCSLVPVEGDAERRRAQVPPFTVPAPDWDPGANRPGSPHHRNVAPGDVIDSANVTMRNIHKPHAYAYYVRDSLSDVPANNGGNTLRLHRGPEAAAHFMLTLMDDVRHIGETLYMNHQNNHHLYVVQETAFRAAVTCYIYGGAFVHPDMRDNVRAHEHRTSTV